MQKFRSIIKVILCHQFSRVVVTAFLALIIWRLADTEQDKHVWRELIKHSPVAPLRFDQSFTEQLPEPARRYFRYSIAPGTPLLGVAEISMQGEIGFGSSAEPNYKAMAARQILAPPFGLIWRVNTAVLSGSDVAMPTYSWTRFRMHKLIPVVRVGHDHDHHLAAFGRVIAEAAIWSPAALLPAYSNGYRVDWSAVTADVARATVQFGDFEQAVDITVNELGQPTRIEISRWSNENTQNIFQRQPFGGYLSKFKSFDGYTLATEVEGGNMIGTGAYFPFYRAKVDDIYFHMGEDNP